MGELLAKTAAALITATLVGAALVGGFAASAAPPHGTVAPKAHGTAATAEHGLRVGQRAPRHLVATTLTDSWGGTSGAHK